MIYLNKQFNRKLFAVFSWSAISEIERTLTMNLKCAISIQQTFKTEQNTHPSPTYILTMISFALHHFSSLPSKKVIFACHVAIDGNEYPSSEQEHQKSLKTNMCDISVCWIGEVAIWHSSHTGLTVEHN